MFLEGADVNETDTLGETALAIAEKFGHKDGARQLFLYRWQVRAAKAEKVAQPPLYHHQQCDTANPVWLSGNQVGQLLLTILYHVFLEVLNLVGLQ